MSTFRVVPTLRGYFAVRDELGRQLSPNRSHKQTALEDLSQLETFPAFASLVSFLGRWPDEERGLGICLWRVPEEQIQTLGQRIYELRCLGCDAWLDPLSREILFICS